VNRWFVVQTRPKGEELALQHLERQGFKAYLPRHLKRRSHARKIDWISSPLFPRYLFVMIDVAAARWRAIRSTTGVSDLICQGNSPLAVFPGVVEEIIGRETDEGYVDMSRHPAFRKGDKVVVESGALCDQVGLFESMADNDRVLILLNLLGRQVKTKVSIDDISAYA